ncbi:MULTISPECIES: AzlD domain-containing protein [unclassified Microbulbifer]|uniref:AzlD family protein n=1 Tax=unclassified Microbulbifer TaxID=2619833 RepID=UPI0027E4D8B2|nr:MULTISPECIES: AzlD domain-containing protein [unclassified Microbulbifer]
MNVETAGVGTLAIVLSMAVVTLATRWGGIYVMSFVPISYRVKQFIQAMSGSVLVALLAPMAVAGDNGARLALLTTATIMLLLKKPLPAIAAGILAAALLRQF